MSHILTLKTVIEDCKACSLRQHCSQVVAGQGPDNAKLMIVIENPGVDEDILGEPCSGRPGQLFLKLLVKAGIERNSVYITHAVKCKSHKVSREDVASCKSWLWKEIQTIKPKVIMTLGKIPTGLLLKLKSFALKDVVGKQHRVSYSECIIVPWYDADYLLNRGVAWEKETVNVLRSIKELL